MKKHIAEDLLTKYRQGTCSDEEKAIVESWHLKELASKTYVPLENELEETEGKIWAALPVNDDTSSTGRIRTFFWLRSAAAVIFVISIGLYLFSKKAETPKYTSNKVYKKDIEPGGNKAILTLPDGSKIVLDNAKNGVLASYTNAAINKTRDGQLIYKVSDLMIRQPDLHFSEQVYSMITTPTGGQYQVILSDGTKVWLNSSSSLRFPLVFGNKERRVELTGEGYFEVVKNKDKPFRVTTSGQTVEVLGTRFNILAYNDEANIKTTLLEGSVKIMKADATVLLKPGEQAETSQKGSNIHLVTDAQTAEAVAWKNGYFMFANENIQSIMRKVARWYNVEVEYNGTFDNMQFGGMVSRSKNLSEVLKVLELTEAVHFKIIPGDEEGKGRKIIVLP